jgi:hypothetical protein
LAVMTLTHQLHHASGRDQFRRDRALPASVRGPVLRFALARLALICFRLAMLNSHNGLVEICYQLYASC